MAATAGQAAACGGNAAGLRRWAGGSGGGAADAGACLVLLPELLPLPASGAGGASAFEKQQARLGSCGSSGAALMGPQMASPPLSACNSSLKQRWVQLTMSDVNRFCQAALYCSLLTNIIWM